MGRIWRSIYVFLIPAGEPPAMLEAHLGRNFPGITLFPIFDFSHLISQALHSCVILLPYINLNRLVIFPDL